MSDLRKRKKKGGWSLKRIRVGVSALFGKVEAEWEKEIPRKSTRKQRTRIRAQVGIEVSQLAKSEGQPQNIIASTVSEIADKERKKAIRRGDYGEAIAASIVQYYADQATKK